MVAVPLSLYNLIYITPLHDLTCKVDAIMTEVARMLRICDPICKNPEQSRREHIAVQTKTLLSVVPCIFCFVFKVII